MSKLTRDDLYSLEKYAAIRQEFRTKVIEHKENRRLAIGPHATLYFEDNLTMQYQVQEMLRLERIFEQEGIQQELDVYNSLIPDGSNWKATLLVEYPDVEERRTMLTRLKGLEDRVWVQAAGCERVYAIADEDLERENAEKTSAVHFLRFELAPPMISALVNAAALAIGVDHPIYTATVESVSPAVRTSLVQDLRG